MNSAASTASPPPATGVLVSQIGYDQGRSKRIVLRSDRRDRWPGNVPFAVGDVFTGRCEYWGERWHAHWWVGDFTACDDEGTHQLIVDGKPQGDPIRIGRDLLWHETFEWTCLDQLEKRAVLAGAKVGWMDAGMPWQESNAHSSAVLGLCDVLEFAGDRLTTSHRERVIAQVLNGNDYNALLQDEAKKRDHPAGGLSHMTPRFEDDVITPDASKAAYAWARSARLIEQTHVEKAREYRERAEAALEFCLSNSPRSDVGFSCEQRGLPTDYTPPRDEHPTRDLLIMAAAADELGDEDRLLDLLRQAMQRQATEDEAIDGLAGFFFEFSDRHHPEPIWAHQIKSRPVGIDAGASFSLHLWPLLSAVNKFAGRDEAADWDRCLRQFTHDYLLPACGRNPFGLLPVQLTREHGLIDFAGPWHGFNSIYGQVALLATQLADHFEMPELHNLATANLQWVAGLNAGVTSGTAVGQVISSSDVPAGAALPVSMIHGIGHRWAGSWLNLHGNICNGFATGEQFKFDVPVSTENDGPHSLTDEDWIPHAAAWFGALARLSRA